MADTVRAPIPQRTERLVEPGDKPKPSGRRGRWSPRPDVSYSEWTEDEDGKVAFEITAAQRKWMEDSYYGDFKASIGFTKWWYAISNSTGGDANMRPTQRAAKQWYNAQEVNQLFKPVVYPKTVVSLKAKRPFSMMQADAISLGKFSVHGFKYIYNVIDNYSKFAWSAPFTTMTGANAVAAVSHALEQIRKWTSEGDPDAELPSIRLTVDNGPETSQDLFVEPLRRKYPTLTIVKAKTYSPNTQGQVEKFNQTLQRMMSKRHHVSGFPKRKNMFGPWLAELVRIYNDTASQAIRYNKPTDMVSLSKKERADRATQLEASKPQSRPNYPKTRLEKDAATLLKKGTRVRIVDRQWKKAALKGNLKYRAKASTDLYTVVRHARRVLDRPVRVYLADEAGKEQPYSFSVHELVIANDVDEAPGLASRTRNEGARSYKRVRAAKVPDLYLGKEITFKWSDGKWYPAVIGPLHQRSGLHALRFPDETRSYYANLAGLARAKSKRVLVEGTDYAFV